MSQLHCRLPSRENPNQTIRITLSIIMTSTPIAIPGIPVLRWLDENTPGTVEIDAENKSVTMTTTKQTDWFNPPIDPSSPAALSNAPALVFQAPQNSDWQLSAMVTVHHHYLFDAGTLFLHQGPNDWCKVCFEYSPERVPVVVSVVTRDISDDANGPPILNDGSSSTTNSSKKNSVYLRISKKSTVLAFHYSVDGGKYWTLHRAFSMRDMDAAMSIGFLAQAPTGDSCTANFSDIQFRETTLRNLRDGS